MSVTSSSGGELIGVSQIARLAGVGPSLVIHWRKTQPTFPAAAGKGGRGELYDPGQVLAWLREHNRLSDDATIAAVVWQAADSLRGKLSPEDYLPVLLAAVGGQPPPVRLADSITSTEWGELVSRLESDTAHWSDSAVRGAVIDTIARGKSSLSEFYTAPALRTALVRLIEPVRGDVLDPAVGTGGLLASAAAVATSNVRLHGADVSSGLVDLARLRLVDLGAEADIRQGDSLGQDPFPDLLVDAIVCDPPYGLRRDDKQPLDAGLAAAMGTTADDPALYLAHAATDAAWLYLAAAHLRPGGRAAVISTPSLLWGAGRRRWLSELLRAGSVDSIVTLPGGLAASTNIALVAWILRGATRETRNSPVLLIDATNDDYPWVADPTGSADRVLNCMAQLRRGQESIDGVAVDLLDLLDPEASLVPARWLALSQTPDQETAASSVSRAFNVLSARLRASEQLVLPQVEFGPSDRPPIVTLGELQRRGQLKIGRGINLKREQIGDTGATVISPEGLDNLIAQATGRSQHVPPSAYRTSPGTVVFLPLGGRVRAGVDEDGGSALNGSLVGLELDPIDPVMEPRLLAALLSSAKTAGLSTGAALQRVSVPDVPVPILSKAEATRVLALIDQVSKIYQSGRDLASGAQDLQTSLLDAMWAGVLPEPYTKKRPGSDTTDPGVQ